MSGKKRAKRNNVVLSEATKSKTWQSQNEIYRQEPVLSDRYRNGEAPYWQAQNIRQGRLLCGSDRSGDKPRTNKPPTT